ncbi:MAG: FG-GAP-like repeat-containing protein [Ignavibacteriaceae bacterium]|jgi:hypothetical protein|nr:FG-GAP-like repeat-containing protein [Ignavibacteriaceae bacterium]
MKSLVLISYILLLTSLAIAQEYKPYNTFNKESELQKFVERGGKVEEISPDVYRLTYRTGESNVFYLGSKESPVENNKNFNTTIINVWEIDTTKFEGMFTFWQKVQLSNDFYAPIPVGDLNNNGRLEIYGYTDVSLPGFIGPVRVYEQNTNGIFTEVFQYPSSTLSAKTIGDVNNDGNKEIILISTYDPIVTFLFYPVYTSPALNTLPTSFDFKFYLDSLQINDMVFNDLDNNGIIDCALTTSLVWDTTMIAISEYRESINNFEEVFRFKSIFESVFSGFAIDDFDQDGKTELVASSGPGNVFVIENKNENEYSIVNQFPFLTYNAYMQTKTNDIDRNGKTEFWVGGQDFEEGITVYQCYEASGNNTYNVVARIELRYATSFGANYIQAIDMDNDGREELVISSGNIILILQFTGSPDNHQYKIWYAKMGEATQPGAEFCITTMNDFNRDGKMDLLIPMDKYIPSFQYAFSYILKRNESSEVKDLINNVVYFETLSAYPNPFNFESTINFSIIESSSVQIKIYNALGKEITTLLDKELSPGNYNIYWNAKDKIGNMLPSGIYLIFLKTKNSIKTFKSILLK